MITEPRHFHVITSAAVIRTDYGTWVWYVWGARSVPALRVLAHGQCSTRAHAKRSLYRARKRIQNEGIANCKCGNGATTTES